MCMHELIGHANSLASPRIAGLYERAGQVAGRLHGSSSRRAARPGVLVHARVRRGDGSVARLRTYGAGLLSSFGEITNFRNADVRPFDTDAMGKFSDYEISTFQEVLFAADVVRRCRSAATAVLRRARCRLEQKHQASSSANIASNHSIESRVIGSTTS